MTDPPTPPRPKPQRLRVGCAMWANRAWVGPFFPSKTPQGDELATYATWCTTVEGNTTFYAVPPADTVARWNALAPPDFRFCFKVPQHVTHERRLRNIAEPLNEFIDALAPIHDRLGPIQIQLPASFGPDDLPVLISTLDHLPQSHLPHGHSWAVEVRHPDFFAGGDAEMPLNELLVDRGIDRVTLDSRAMLTAAPQTREEIEAWERKPRLPVRPVATGAQPIVRLIGQRDSDRNIEEWSPWIPKLIEWVKAGATPHVFTHTPDNSRAPELARRMWALVAEHVEDLEPLPEPETDSEQLGLW